MRLAALLFASIALGAVVLAFAWLRMIEAQLETPLDPSGSVELVEIPEGIVIDGLVELFQREGLVADNRLIDIYARYLHRKGEIVGGEYRLGPGLTLVQLIQRVERGRVHRRTLTLPAGVTIREAANILAEERIIDEEAFVAAAQSRALAARLGVDGPSVEGFIFPDVWALPRGIDAQALVTQLVERFFQRTPSLAEDAARVGLTPYQLVVVASLVERGPIPPQERRLYAALLIERLQKGYALESEAADAYGRSRPNAPADLRRDPWNTTERPGLPLTPIGSPSLPSLRAAADPTDTEPVFTVRRRDGRHVYCPDVPCYLRALERHAPGRRAHFPKRFDRRGPTPP